MHVVQLGVTSGNQRCIVIGANPQAAERRQGIRVSTQAHACQASGPPAPRLIEVWVDLSGPCEPSQGLFRLTRINQNGSQIGCIPLAVWIDLDSRSEEHTSELQ